MVAFRRRTSAWVVLVVLAASFTSVVGGASPPASAATGSTSRVSVSSAAAEANAPSGFPSVSGDGRLVAFQSDATNLAPGAGAGGTQIYVHDRTLATTTLVSAVDGAANPGNGSSTQPAISLDGRFVAFQSDATNLVSGDTNGVRDVFVRELATGHTQRVSGASVDLGTNGEASDPAISADGSFVAFSSVAMSGATPIGREIYRVARASATTEVVSVVSYYGESGFETVPSGYDNRRPAISADGQTVAWDSDGSFSCCDYNEKRDVYRRRLDSTFVQLMSSAGESAGSGASRSASLSADGLRVAFVSDASDLGPGGGGVTSIFLRDLGAGLSLISATEDGAAAAGASDSPAISADGRYVAFQSIDNGLLPGESEEFNDVFVADTRTGALSRASVGTSGAQNAAPAADPALSSDGRTIAFAADGASLVAGDGNGVADVFVHVAPFVFVPAGPSTLRVSESSAGAEADAFSEDAVVSGNGLWVAFTSLANNLASYDTKSQADVFVRNRITGRTALVSQPSDNGAYIGNSGQPAISYDGRHVAFVSDSENLVLGDANNKRDVFVRDRDTDGNGIYDEPGGVSTTLVSVRTLPGTPNGHSGSPSISGDGQRIAFVSFASDIVDAPTDDNGVSDVYVRDLSASPTPITYLVSRGPSAVGNGASDQPVISRDGTSIAYRSLASNVNDADTNGVADIFLANVGAGQSVRISEASDGTQANGPSESPSMTPNAILVAFSSDATNLVPGDVTGHKDVFVRDRDSDHDFIGDEAGAVSTVRVSLAASGTEALGQNTEPRISDDGRFVAFTSSANGLVADDNDASFDVFVRDRDSDADGIFDEAASTTILASRSATGANLAGFAGGPSVSGDGRFVSFESSAAMTAGDANTVQDILLRDLASVPADRASAFADGSSPIDGSGDRSVSGNPSVAGAGRFVAYTSGAPLSPSDDNEAEDVYVYDRLTGANDRVSVASDGTESSFDARNPRISSDGRLVLYDVFLADEFESARNVYLRDRVTRLTTLVSVHSSGEPALGFSNALAISGNGRFAVFSSSATNLGQSPSDTSDEDVFVHDVLTGTTSALWNGAQGQEGAEFTPRASISFDGRYVAFETRAPLVAGDTAGSADVYLVDRTANTVTRVSRATSGEPDASSYAPAISGDGRFVAFSSSASNIVSGDTNGTGDVFVFDRITGSRERASVATSGAQGNGESIEPSISSDGRFVGFLSSASTLAPDVNPASDAFVRDRSLSVTRLMSQDFAGRQAEGDSQSGPPAVSGDGSVVAFATEGDNVAAADGNGVMDVVVVSIPVVPALPPADLTGLSLTVNKPSIEAGAAAIPLASIPLERIPALASKMSEADLGRVDLQSSPIGSIPIGSIGLEAATYDPSALDHVLLSSIPIDWDPILDGSPLAGLNKNSVTLRDVLDDASAGPKFLQAAESIPLAKFGIDRNLLRGTSVVSALLGSAPIGSIPTPGGAPSWCAVLNSAGYACTSLDEDHTTMLGLDIAGAPIGSIPIGSIPIGSIPIGSIPIGSIPIGSIALVGPIGSIPIGSISARAQIVDCARISCDPADGKTLLDAARMTPTAIRSGATVQMLAGAFGDITLGELIVALLVRSDFPWESVPIDGLQDVAGGPSMEYTASYQFTCSDPVEISTRVQAPPGFQYVPGSTKFDYQVVGGSALPLPPAGPDPARSGSTLTWSGLPGAPCGGRAGVPIKVRARYSMRPGLVLGDFSSAITVVLNGIDFAKSGVATVNVTESFEPNDSKDTATPIQFDHLIVGHLSHAGDEDIFKLALPQGRQRVFFSLSHLSSDFDLLVHVPKKQSLQSSPIGSIPIGSIPVEDEGGDFHDDGQAPPETLSDVPIGSIPLLGPIGSISANREEAPERASIVTDGTGGIAYIRVVGYNGAFSVDPFVLRAWTYGPAPLPPAPPRVLPFDPDPWNGNDEAGTRGSLPATIASDRQTLFVVNQDRLYDRYGSQAAQDVLSTLAVVAARPEVRGFVLPVDGSASFRSAFAAWDADPNSNSAANGVVRAVNDVVATYRPSLPQLRYIVLVGDDEALAHARFFDPTTLSNEIDESADLAFTTDRLTKGNASYASSATGQILTDLPYGSFTTYPFLDTELPLPDVSVARLVESPADIVAQLRQYVAANGVADPQSALVTGYNFLADGATITADALAARFGDAKTQRMINETWTREDLIDAFVGANPIPDVAAVNAHFSHNLAQPAGATSAAGLFSTADIPAPPADALTAGRYDRMVLFTVGCHSGRSVSDSLISSATPEEAALLKDWPQTWGAQRLAVYVANTTFGYGDTTASALSERLMNLLAQRIPDDSTTMGEKWVAAQHEYFRTAGAYGVYDFKSLLGAQMYGLPFYRLGPAAAPPATNQPPATSPDAVTGLQSASITQTPALTRVDTPGRGTHWSGPNGTVDVHYRPIEPLASASVSVPNLSAHGAIITALTTTDVPGIDPNRSRPTIDHDAHEPEIVVGEDVFPAHIVSLARSRAFGQETATLNLIAGQYRPNDTHDGRGTQRLVVSATTRVAYSTSPDVTSPVVDEFHVTELNASTVRIWARASDESAAGVKRVAGLYRAGSGGTWGFVELARVGQTNVWQADVAVPAGAGAGAASIVSFEAIGQAQDAAGNVGISTNKGLLHPARSDVAGPSIVIQTPTPLAAYARSSSVYAAYSCSDPSGVASCTGTVPNGGALDTGSYGIKTLSVTATDSAGNTATKSVSYLVVSGSPPPASDSTPPTTQFSADDDLVLSFSPVVADVIPGRAWDDLSGVERVTVRYTPILGGAPFETTARLTCASSENRTCTWQADPPASPGQYRVTAWSKDRAGNVESATAHRSIIVI